MLTIHYFASVREAVERSEEQLELPENVANIGDLIEHLLLLHPHFEAVFHNDLNILIAVNQTVVDKSQALDPGDEIAFFPPMTGG